MPTAVFCKEKLYSSRAPHSSTLAQKIPWVEEPGRLQSMGSLRVGHDWATSLSLFSFTHWRRKWQPTPVFLPGESQGRGAWWAAVYGVTQSRTRLKWLSSKQSEADKNQINDFLIQTLDLGLITQVHSVISDKTLKRILVLNWLKQWQSF